MNYISKMFRRQLKLIAVNLVIAFLVLTYLKRQGAGHTIILLAAAPFVILIHSLGSKLIRLLSGAYGEDEAYDVLSRKLGGYTVLRNVDIGAGDVDLLVVGKSGVHVVEVKRIKYTATADRNSVRYGRRQFLGQIERNEARVKNILKKKGMRVPVKGHLLVLGKVKGRNSKLVTNPGALARRIKGWRRMSRKDVARVVGIFSR